MCLLEAEIKQNITKGQRMLQVTLTDVQVGKQCLNLEHDSKLGQEIYHFFRKQLRKKCETCNVFGNHCLLLIAFVSGSVQGRNMYLFTAVE